ncbi:hypothetical protein QMK19_29205 [Streptomyces sp. H10-C2]|uniref:hypothetical protein n=1 Tax=unclassified Streptomyces TaxID=2593676 RepID=UPI0024B9D991|nr:MULTISPECIES: hypothetical protein [unclassified Streptomyces]MDJ0344198.1 hypothetical protein [Streptomyces sp. PH10-H1]MDJ0373628.1 hypothetical protein [Streptomyces sp. H10-C2]MDJ0383730.1 hypothetical protein [Streptomyces sp. G-G2]
MTVPPPRLAPEDVRAQLLRLRQGPALGHPGAVTALSDQLRALLLARQPPLSRAGSETTRLVAALRRAIDALSPHERRYTATDFNLLPEHSWPHLTERQESLARVLGCSAKTVRRHAGQALDTLALLISDGSYLTEPPPPADDAPAPTATGASETAGRFFGVTATSRVDVVCSALPKGTDRQRPGDPLYARYAGFADLDALFYVRVRLAQTFPTATIRDFHPGEYYSAEPDCLIVLGAPHRNTAYADFGPHLPCRFTPPPDAAITFPGHGDIRLTPLWAPEGELLADLTVITRLTLGQGTTVILLGGCLTLGVLGAAKCLLNGERGRRNTAYLNNLAPGGDLIAVIATRKIGGITDTTDLTATEPLLLLTRDTTGGFTTRLDNTARYTGR